MWSMTTPTESEPRTGPREDRPQKSFISTLLSRITRLEIAVAAVVAAGLVVLVLIEPEILEAPFENSRTLLFTFGGTALAAIALIAMLWLRVPPIVRLVVLLVPFALVNWWLISPYFIDDVVDEEFSTSISDQLGTQADSSEAAAPTTADEEEAQAPPTTGTDGSPTETTQAPAETTESVPATEPPATTITEPVLLGAGQFVGLAGHSGTGDAGIFRNPDGSLVLRFENFDIQNGPDLEVYLVPGVDQTSLSEGSIHLGALKGNVGDQNYDLPPGTELAPGGYTALVWCDAFTVEFVGATINV